MTPPQSPQRPQMAARAPDFEQYAHQLEQAFASATIELQRVLASNEALARYVLELEAKLQPEVTDNGETPASAMAPDTLG